jgi:glutamate racemase
VYDSGINARNRNKEPIRLLVIGNNHYNLLVPSVSKKQPQPKLIKTTSTSVAKKLEDYYSPPHTTDNPENQENTFLNTNQTQANRTQKQQQQTST